MINALGSYEKLRFNGLMEQLDGVGPKTLSDTLKILGKRVWFGKSRSMKSRRGLSTR